jgi:5-methylcytosine-specific restriction endonuclease McrA
MKLTTLKPRLQTAGNRLATLATAKPGTVERLRGSAGMRDRNRIRARDEGTCRNCGRLGSAVDHDTPLWAGGTDDDGNKQLLCEPCHGPKTALEATQRAAGHYDRAAVLRLMARLRLAAQG